LWQVTLRRLADSRRAEEWTRRTETMKEIDVAALIAVRKGEARGFKMDGQEIVLCNVAGEIYALEGMCTHQNLPLDGGEVEDGVLTCEWHGAEFDVCTGSARTLPATRGLRSYETRVRDGRIYVLVETGGGSSSTSRTTCDRRSK
jgi:3-phenylpropionate/trans-cinnamate dioxygenase ferredoxin component